MSDPGQSERLRQYVQGVIGAYRYDKRILAWDLWNEPDNLNDSSYKNMEPKNKQQLVLALLPKVFAWARAVDPLQPLTSGVWKGDWSSPDKLDAIQKIQLNESDVISFHNYDGPAEFEKRMTVATGVEAADSLYGVHGAAERQHISGDSAGGQEVQRGGDQLGIREREIADESAVGLLAEAVYGPGAGGVVPRRFSQRRHAIPRRKKWISSGRLQVTE